MKLEQLKDGSAVVIREPTRADVPALHRFFLGLSPDDRRYLRLDVTRLESVQRMVEQAERGEAYRIIALSEDTVVGNGVLEFKGDGWRRHIGEIRVITAAEFRRRHLGALMISELFLQAQHREVERVEARMVEAQATARRVFERLGFKVDAVLENHVKDAEGKLQSLIVMSCTMDEAWHELKDFYDNGDWPDG